MPKQLKMEWRPSQGELPVCLPDGYHLRCFRSGDEEGYAQLLDRCDLGPWDVERVRNTILAHPLSPEGVTLVENEGKLVASSWARHAPDTEGTGRRRGELGWVACSPEHRGQRLGRAVCAAVLNHFLASGYDEVYLLTDHWRLPAIKTYFNLGFRPLIDSADARYEWARVTEKLGLACPEIERSRSRKRPPSGEETAWRTLCREAVKEPSIVASWCMKRELFSFLSHRDDIYADAPDTVVEAFVRAGVNLCPQFVMPSPEPGKEHLAVDPFSVAQRDRAGGSASPLPSSPEDVRDYIETLPDPVSLEKDFDLEAAADRYADYILKLRELARGEILFVNWFGMPDFMTPYSWGYTNYLTAMALYPEHVERWFHITGKQGRLRNLAIARAVEKRGLAPFVYGGQDICCNRGPICSVQDLRKLFFPHLIRAVQPLHEAGIKIIWHCDGDVRPLLDILLFEVGVSGFQGFQEETGCTLEGMTALRTRRGEPPVLWGSVSVTTTLPFGSVQDVKDDVERCYRTAAPLRGFCLASTSSIGPETPLANILALYEHGLVFGRRFLGGL